jgi:uncharacterized LabA/DUF88 family protein
VVVLIDGQNLFHATKTAFGRRHPDYDPQALAAAICAKHPDWDLVQTRFYTGIHSEKENYFWHHYWVSKLQTMGTRGVETFTRNLRYQRQQTVGPDGKVAMFTVPMEKGIDVRMALDAIRIANDGSADVLLFFSQDQDLSEVAEEIKRVSIRTNRWLKVASAFPAEARARGIQNTDWIPFDATLYKACLDRVNHVPASRAQKAQTPEAQA